MLNTQKRGVRVVCSHEGCGKSFVNKYVLQNHQLAHEGFKPFQCSECGKCFSSKASLKEHAWRHSDLQPLECRVCHRKFRQVSCLHRHMTTHSTNQPFSCHFCGRMFAQGAYLRSHLKTDTGDKPFECGVCHRRFAHMSDVKRHQTTHTGERPHTCDICPSRFSDVSSKKRHMRTHGLPLAHSCSTCHMAFTRANQLRAHISRDHSTDSTHQQLETFHMNGDTNLIDSRLGLRELLTDNTSKRYNVVNNNSLNNTRVRNDLTNHTTGSTNISKIIKQAPVCETVDIADVKAVDIGTLSCIEGDLITHDIPVIKTDKIVTSECVTNTNTKIVNTSTIITDTSTGSVDTLANITDTSTKIFDTSGKSVDTVTNITDTSEKITCTSTKISEATTKTATSSTKTTEPTALDMVIHHVDENGQILLVENVTEKMNDDEIVRMLLADNVSGEVIQVDKMVLMGGKLADEVIYSDPGTPCVAGYLSTSIQNNNITEKNIRELKTESPKQNDCSISMNNNEVPSVRKSARIHGRNTLLAKTINKNNSTKQTSLTTISEKEKNPPILQNNSNIGLQKQSCVTISSTDSIDSDPSDYNIMKNLNESILSETDTQEQNLNLQSTMPSSDIHVSDKFMDNSKHKTTSDIQEKQALNVTGTTDNLKQKSIITHDNQNLNIPDICAKSTDNLKHKSTCDVDIHEKEDVKVSSNLEMSDNTNNEPNPFADASAKCDFKEAMIPDNVKESNQIDYIKHPDLTSQDYYNWLSSFTEHIKQLSPPLTPDTFNDIAHVCHTITQAMAQPDNVLHEPENYRIMLDIRLDLNSVLDQHTAFVLRRLEQPV